MLVDSSKGFEHGPKVYLDIVYVHTTVKHLDTLGHETERVEDTLPGSLDVGNEAV